MYSIFLKKKYSGLHCWILYGLKAEKKNFNTSHVLTIETALAVLQSTKIISVNSVTSTTSSFCKNLAIVSEFSSVIANVYAF